MKKLIFTFLVFTFFIPSLFAQRIIINENFENTGFGSDSLPPNWFKFSEDPISGPGREWAVRDSGTGYVGTSSSVKAHCHDGHRSLTIPWSAGNPIADDWTITDTFTVSTGDSLMFWMLIGSPEGWTAYLDTMQVWVMSEQIPAFALTKLATIKSNDSAGIPLATNDWKYYKFSLSAFIGQRISIGFRYYMNTTNDGLWCNIDEVFVGNHSSVGINLIGTNLPKKYSLYQNYPNPFNPETKIRFDVPRNSNVKIEIYNSIGQLVKVIHDGFTAAGNYEATFNASSLSSGTYFYRLTTPDFVETKKMVLVK